MCDFLFGLYILVSVNVYIIHVYRQSLRTWNLRTQSELTIFGDLVELKPLIGKFEKFGSCTDS